MSTAACGLLLWKKPLSGPEALCAGAAGSRSPGLCPQGSLARLAGPGEHTGDATCPTVPPSQIPDVGSLGSPP